MVLAGPGMTGADAHGALFAALDLVDDGAIVVRRGTAPGAATRTWVVDHCTTSAARLLSLGRGGQGPARPVGVALSALLPDDGELDVLAELDRCVADGSSRRARQTWRASDGTILVTVEVTVGPLPDGRLLLVLRDREAAAAGPPHPDADRDPLTGLPGRATLRRALLAAQRRRLAGGRGFAVVLMGLDRLAGVNASRGSRAGDAQLQEFADRLRAASRDTDTVARLGGDRFGLVLAGLDRDDDADRVHHRIRDVLLRTMEHGGRPLPVSASAGVVLDARPDVDPDDLLAQAESAMIAAKGDGPGSLAVFDAATTQGAGPLVTSGELARATAQAQLRLHYQPVVDVVDGRAAGAEALLRWQHPNRGLLGPPEFLDAAEASDEILRIGHWVLDEAVAQVSRWERVADLTYYRVGVNVTPRQLLASDVVGEVAAALERHGVSGDRLILEIVESDVLDVRSTAAAQIRALRDLGLRVAVDDFGAGHTSLGWLRDLPVDLVKVDRALVGLRPTARERAILRAVVGLGDAIGADILLEGVEREEQLDLARSTGVRFAQGLLVGPPVPAADDVPVRPRWRPAGG